LLDTKKQNISYHASTLEKRGILRRKIPDQVNKKNWKKERKRTYIIHYEKGPRHRAFERKWKSEFGEIGDHRGWLDLKVPEIENHLICYQFPVVERPVNLPPNWTRHWDASTVLYWEWELELDWIEVPDTPKWARVRYIEGPEKKSLAIWVEKQNASSDPDVVEKFPERAQDRSQRIANFFQLQWGFKLGLIGEYQPSHYAMEMDRDVVDHAVENGIRTEEVYFDRSDGHRHMETKIHDIAKVWANMPRILDGLAKSDDVLSTDILDVKRIVIKLVDNTEKIQENNRLLVDTLKSAFSGPSNGKKKKQVEEELDPYSQSYHG